MKKRVSAVRWLALCLAMAMMLLVCSCNAAPQEQPVSSPAASAPASSTDAEAEDEPVVRVFGEYDMTLERLQFRLNEERRAANAVSDTDLTQYLPDYTSPDFIADEFTEDEIDILTTEPEKVPSVLLCTKAKEDVDTLFRLLRTSYGAYTFFGGDEVFGAARQEILRRLDESFADGISPDAFCSLLLRHLSFVEDDHFTINWKKVDIPEQRTYMDKNELIFREDENGWYTILDESDQNRWYLAEEDEPWLRLTIADDGELVYGLFTMDRAHLATSLRRDFTLTDSTGQTAVYNASWKMVLTNTVSENNIFERYDRDGVPVLRLSSFMFTDELKNEANAYFKSGRSLRHSDVIVIDLRSNSGGYSSMNYIWLEELTEGAYIASGVGQTAYVSTLNARMQRVNSEAFYEVFDEFESTDSETDSTEFAPQGTAEVFSRELGFYENDRNVIFVLFNKDTSSAGELALMQFRHMSNTVLVGTNSNGCLLVGNINSSMPVWLPNSGLNIQYGMDLMITDEMDGFDARGVIPDIIVDNDTAIADVVNCWNYYNQD